MTLALKLRAAIQADSALLLRWRNDPETRAASIETGEVARDEHERWLSASLANSSRKLWIAEDPAGTPVGTARADLRAPGEWELSWTVAPEARGRGVGKALVSAAAGLIAGGARGQKITARIKAGHLASEAIARHAGFAKIREEGGIGFWERK